MITTISMIFKINHDENGRSTMMGQLVSDGTKEGLGWLVPESEGFAPQVVAISMGNMRFLTINFGMYWDVRFFRQYLYLSLRILSKLR